MVFNYQPPQVSGDIVWDFRQFYTEWVKIYVNNFTIAHLKNDYPKMYEALIKWHPIIWGRAIKNDFQEGKIDNNFSKIIINIKRLANKYEKTYLGKERNPEAVEELEIIFNEAASYLVWLMKKNKMFGSENVNRGL